MTLVGHIFECFAPIWWNCLEKIKRRVLVRGDMSLVVGFKFLKFHPFPLRYLCLMIVIRYKLSPPGPVPWLPACYFVLPTMIVMVSPSAIVTPTLNVLL